MHGRLMAMTAVDTTTTRAAARAAECCPATLTGGVLSAEDAEQLARLLKALADPTRLRLLSMVAAHESGEACICDLTDPVGLSQGTVSHHMKVLVEAGILTREQRGKWAYYALVTNTLSSLAASIAHPSRCSTGDH
jgi:ArsR family transcriptional regulator, arsenate/arsenite/antimonite-responsive transcriptional repressor